MKKIKPLIPLCLFLIITSNAVAHQWHVWNDTGENGGTELTFDVVFTAKGCAGSEMCANKLYSEVCARHQGVKSGDEVSYKFKGGTSDKRVTVCQDGIHYTKSKTHGDDHTYVCDDSDKQSGWNLRHEPCVEKQLSLLPSW